MSVYAALLLLIGLAGVLLGCCAFIAWLEKKVPSKQFDERQQLVRGRAYKWAIVTGFCYFVVIAVLDLFLPSGVQMSIFLLTVTGLMLEAFVCECYCCFHDAHLPLTRSPKANIALLYTMGVLYLIHALNRIQSMTIVLTGDTFYRLSISDVRLGATGDGASVWAFLIVAVASIVIATMELVRYLRAKAE